MTYAQAKEIADRARDILGLDYMEVNYAAANAYNQPGAASRDIADAAGYSYHFVYTRSVAGAGVTYTQNEISSIKLDYMPWAYEYFEVWVDDDGLQRVMFVSCPSKAGDNVSDDVPLLPFDGIMEIAIQNFRLGQFKHSRNSHELEYMLAENRATVYDDSIVIDKIALGYMHVRQETGEYLLVPVWDFVGRESVKMDIKHKTEDSIHAVETQMPEYGYGDQHSFLTINAVDGSIIDRSLGY